MKKLIGALALAAMVATSAFAEVSFGAWICNLPTLIASDGEDMKSGIVNPWGSWRPVRFAANWASDDGKAGMTMGVCIENGKIDTFTPNTFWIKPVDQVKVIVGMMDNSFGVRSDLCYGSWDWLRPNNAIAWGEGITFGAYDKKGLGVEITPTEALKIFVTVPLAEGYGDTWKVFGHSAAGATYTIDGIGTIKAGFNAAYDGGKAGGKWNFTGSTNTDGYDTFQAALDDAAKLDQAAVQSITRGAYTYGGKSELGTIQAAFDLTGVDKLYATLGVAFKLHEDSDQQSLTVAAGASYGITETFKVAADVAFQKSFASGSDPAMSFGAGINYALTDALGLVADVRMALPFASTKDPSLSFLAGLNYSCGSNASLGLGFQGAVGLGKKADAGNLQVVKASAADKFAWAVPIRASFWF